jgi:hypothetical protein
MILGTRTKTEDIMNSVRGLFKSNRRKYLVICRTGNNKSIDYIDASNDLEFLKRCKEHIETLIERKTFK